MGWLRELNHLVFGELEMFKINTWPPFSLTAAICSVILRGEMSILKVNLVEIA